MCFDQHNIRYITSTVIGEWARDKLTRYALLTGNGDPYIWDFGSAAKHHRLHAPWLHHDHCRAGLLGLRGAVGGDGALFRDAAREIKSLLDAEGVADMPLGLDVVEPPMLFELQKLGIEVRDGQQTLLAAREVKNIDELTLLNMAAAMVDGVYQDIAEALKPGVKESEIVALATARLYEMGSDCVEAINSISGERCSPHPHNFTDRLIRPGDQAFFDIIQSFMGYRTCYYRTFNVGMATSAQHTAYRYAREWMDKAIDLLKPGVTTDKIARAFPKAEEIGFASEMEAFGLNFCHGLGLGLHERPLVSRLNSLDEPIELKVGHGVRGGDLLPCEGRHLRGADRGGSDSHADRTEGDFAFSGAGAAHRQSVLKLPGDKMTARKPEDLDRLFEQALNAGKLDDLVALYEPQATLMPMPGKLVTGHATIREALAGFVAGQPKISIAPQVAAQTGDIAIVTGKWESRGDRPGRQAGQDERPGGRRRAAPGRRTLAHGDRPAVRRWGLVARQQPAAARIGWIGTGRMGYAMAERLAEGRRRRHGLEPYAQPRRSRSPSTARRSRRSCPSSPAATSCSAWSRPGTT